MATESQTTHPRRYGITIPFEGITLRDHRRWIEDLETLGYSDIWSAEVDGADGFTPLTLASTWSETLRLGVAITPAYTRGPALLAQSVAALADASNGRFAMGLGASSPAIVEHWNGISYVEPFHRVRDTLRFLRRALTGEKVTEDFRTFSVHGFRLATPPAVPPPIYLAALRAGMLRLAATEADGVILNWLSAEDVTTALNVVREARGEDLGDFPVVARIFVIPTEDAERARGIGKRMMAAYLNVGAYADFHRWLGRGPTLQPMWDAWSAGDRKSAVAAIPDELVDQLIVHGSPADCRAHLDRYVAHGIEVPVLAVVPAGVDLADSIRALAPNA